MYSSHSISRELSCADWEWQHGWGPRQWCWGRNRICRRYLWPTGSQLGCFCVQMKLTELNLFFFHPLTLRIIWAVMFSFGHQMAFNSLTLAQGTGPVGLWTVCLGYLRWFIKNQSYHKHSSLCQEWPISEPIWSSSLCCHACQMDRLSSGNLNNHLHKT